MWSNEPQTVKILQLKMDAMREKKKTHMYFCNLYGEVRPGFHQQQPKQCGVTVCGAGPRQRSAFPPPSLERRQKETHSLIIHSICFYFLDIVENSKWGFSPNPLHCSHSPLWLCKKLSSLLIFPRLWPKNEQKAVKLGKLEKQKSVVLPFPEFTFFPSP